jgi:hypothetical protein
LTLGFAAPLAGNVATAKRPVAASETAAKSLNEFLMLNFPPKEEIVTDWIVRRSNVLATSNLETESKRQVTSRHVTSEMKENSQVLLREVIQSQQLSRHPQRGQR